MIPTRGLTHIALAARDPARSAKFYQQVFGAVELFRHADFVQIQTPGSRDAIVFQKADRPAPPPGNMLHFGFLLLDPCDIERAAFEVEAAGGTVLRQGEFCPGEPYLFFLDLDGYEVEVAYEK